MTFTNRKRRLRVAAVSFVALSPSCDAFTSSTSRTFTRVRKTGTSHNTNACHRLSMIRNIDLPECVIFYGSDSILLSNRGVDDGGSSASSSFAIRPGVTRLLAECAEVGTPALLLSEHRRAEDLCDVLLSAVTNADDEDSSKISPFLQDGTLVVKSSLEGCTFAPDHPYFDDDDNDQAYLYGPNNHAPSPGFLLDSVETTAMVPLGFGGSSGFGIKQEGVERRPPLPKHCVVLVSGPDRRPTERDDSSSVDVEAVAASVDGAVIKSDTVSRARCTAAKLAGMRVLYLEPEGMGTSDAEDLADAIVTGLGSDDDWEVVRLDDIATPGSYWLNPPVGKDEAGNRVNLVALCNAFQQARYCGLEGADTQAATSSSSDSSGGEERMSEDEMASILADLDAL